jgi:hypothetical protein
MKTFIGLALGVAVVLTIGACRSHRGYSSPSYSSPSYSYSSAPPSYSTPTPQPPPPVDTMPPTAKPVDTTPPTGKPFPTPQAAIQAVSEILGKHEKGKLEEIFGTGASEVLWSGDEVADKASAEKVKALIDAGVSFDEQGPEIVIAEFGKDKWPMPIPLVKTPEGWRFDLEAGKDELLSRRIGRNELSTIETMYEYVDAQKEYKAKGRDGNPPAYAQKVRSTEGKHDGLFWPAKEGEEESPFGDLVAGAQKSGYGPRGDEPQPFQGYFYKILTAQGPNAPGGRKSYVDSKGLMTGGYAGIAWPASYGNSGIKTFIVSPTGIVFEKDLGDKTEQIAAAVTEYNPDKTWSPSAKPKNEEE